MEDNKPKGVLATLFRPKKSGCCNVKIEEIKDEEEPDGLGGSKTGGVPNGAPKDNASDNDTNGKRKPCC